MSECRAAFRWSVAAVVLAVMALLYSTWYLPGLIRVLDKLSKQVEANNARLAGRDQSTR